MTVDLSAVQWLTKAASKFGSRFLYPGIPFVIVPTLVAGIVGSQYGGSLTYFPADRPAALPLPVFLSITSDQTRQPATLLVFPRQQRDFFLAGMEDGISSVWLSLESARISANRDTILLNQEGLKVDNPRAVRYPLVVVVEGAHQPWIEPAGGEIEAFRKLELATPESDWVVLFLLGGPLFGFGVSTGFLKNSWVIQE